MAERPGLHNQSCNCIIIRQGPGRKAWRARPAGRTGSPEGAAHGERARASGQRVGGSMGARVAVAGASGYAGGELLRLLAGHPDLELGPVTAESNAGRPIAELHPHLAGLPSLAARPFDAADALVTSRCDLAFLALPAGQSARLAGAP